MVRIWLKRQSGFGDHFNCQVRDSRFLIRKILYPRRMWQSVRSNLENSRRRSCQVRRNSLASGSGEATVL